MKVRAGHFTSGIQAGSARADQWPVDTHTSYVRAGTPNSVAETLAHHLEWTAPQWFVAQRLQEIIEAERPLDFCGILWAIERAMDESEAEWARLRETA